MFKNKNLKTPSVCKGDDLPSQLIIKKGKIVKKNGKQPNFGGFAEGVIVSVVPREDLKRLIDDYNSFMNEKLDDMAKKINKKIK